MVTTQAYSPARQVPSTPERPVKTRQTTPTQATPLTRRSILKSPYTPQSTPPARSSAAASPHRRFSPSSSTYSCEREVLHPLDEEAEPGAHLLYDSDDSVDAPSPFHKRADSKPHVDGLLESEKRLLFDQYTARYGSSAPLKILREQPKVFQPLDRLSSQFDLLGLESIEPIVETKRRDSELKLAEAAERHESIRNSALLVYEAEMARIRQQIEAEEARKRLERQREEQAKREVEERRLAEERRKEEAVKAEAERKEQLRKKQEEETRLQAEKAAEEKKRLEDVARKKAEDDARTKKEQEEKAAANKAAAEEARKTAVAAHQSTITGPHADLRQKYSELHKKLKDMRKYIVQEAKQNPQLKKEMGDWRREIKKSLGQLTDDKKKNSATMTKIKQILSDARKSNISTKVDGKMFILDTDKGINDVDQTSQPSEVPIVFIYLINMFSKTVIAQLIQEVSVNPKAADPIGILSSTVFAASDYRVSGVSLIDILMCKFARHAPVIFGAQGPEDTDQGRTRLGWYKDKDSGEWATVQRHNDIQGGLGSGFAAVALRNFSNVRFNNPYPPRHFWDAVSTLTNVKPEAFTDTHAIVLKAMIENSHSRILDSFGEGGTAALRRSIVDVTRAIEKRSPAVNALLALTAAYEKDHLDLSQKTKV